MAIDFGQILDAAPKKEEPAKTSGMANVTIRVDADCMMQCDGEYVDIPLKAGIMSKAQLPTGQHLLEFFNSDNPNIKVEKVVDFPEADKNYLVMVNEFKAQIAPAMPQTPQMQATPQNQFLDQLNQMQGYNPLLAAQQMKAQASAFQQQMSAQLGQQTPPAFPGLQTPPPFSES